MLLLHYISVLDKKNTEIFLNLIENILQSYFNHAIIRDR